jgi:hypothetical protein
LIGLAISNILFTILKEYGQGTLIVDLAGIIGFLYWFFSIPIIIIGILIKEKIDYQMYYYSQNVI